MLTEESRAANFTNEGGVDGRIRYLKNVMGLWLLQESMRDLGAGRRAGRPDRAARGGGGRAYGRWPIFDANDPSLLPPGDMPARIAELCAATGRAGPAVRRPEFARCILESLAVAYADGHRRGRDS